MMKSRRRFSPILFLFIFILASGVSVGASVLPHLDLGADLHKAGRARVQVAIAEHDSGLRALDSDFGRVPRRDPPTDFGAFDRRHETLIAFRPSLALSLRSTLRGSLLPMVPTYLLLRVLII
jgi:hypothetical protein